MLPAENRLSLKGNTTKEYKLKRADQYFLFKVLEKQTNNLEAGLVVSKKVYKKAVDRNRLRRRIYSAIRETFPLDSPTNLIVIAKVAASKATYSEIMTSLAQAKKSLNLSEK